jgi:GrpB-like predicted nucleotidyltransferase (UPF0157 family)
MNISEPPEWRAASTSAAASNNDTNLAVVERGSALWRDNLLIRDFLRAHPDAAAEYSGVKRDAWHDGARTLLAYSERKACHVNALLEAARKWQRELQQFPLSSRFKP